MTWDGGVACRDPGELRLRWDILLQGLAGKGEGTAVGRGKGGLQGIVWVCRGKGVSNDGG